MTPRLASSLMPLLRPLAPEAAHAVALLALRLDLAGRAEPPDPILATTAFGLHLQTPLGLAAGFDKNATAILPLRRLGFGFIETGTITKRPQPGNPRPRLFRLPQDHAIINRMGFNGAGADIIHTRLRRLPAAARPLGINLGINKTGADPLRDYADLVTRFAPLADYLVINVSSPNTPGLRDLQAEKTLAALLATLPRSRPPLLVKLAPDLADSALAPLVEVCLTAGVQGLIVGNTTLDRPAELRGRHRAEPGGLSGAPLFARSTVLLARLFRLAEGRLTLLAAGGVATGADALEKLKAGATLVQLYTALAYAGPALPARINADLAALLRRDGLPSPRAAIGVEAARWSRAA